MNSSSPVPPADVLLTQLTDYALDYTPDNIDAYNTARYCLIDSLGCALRSLNDTDCQRVLGPLLDDIVLTAMIKAYEIQGCLALGNSFNKFGLDHVILVWVDTALVTSVMLGASHQQVFNALSDAWVDGGTLRCYRHAPDTGTRKSWAAGDATARGLWLALLALRGEMGYPHALSTSGWGFQDSLLHGQELALIQPLNCYVMQNILFKVAFPAELHAQTAVEASMRLHAVVGERCDDITRIVIETQQAGMRIINKTGTLKNPADRDHCLQYMVAVALLHGRLSSEDYHDSQACDSRRRADIL